MLKIVFICWSPFLFFLRTKWLLWDRSEISDKRLGQSASSDKWWWRWVMWWILHTAAGWGAWTAAQSHRLSPGLQPARSHSCQCPFKHFLTCILVMDRYCRLDFRFIYCLSPAVFSVICMSEAGQLLFLLLAAILSQQQLRLEGGSGRPAVCVVWCGRHCWSVPSLVLIRRYQLSFFSVHSKRNKPIKRSWTQLLVKMVINKGILISVSDSKDETTNAHHDYN